MNSGPAVVVLICSVVLLSGCGKKGDPLPPLVRVPVAPSDLVAERRAAHADLQFTVPAANTDGTRPANITRVDVYAFTGPSTVSDDELLKRGTRVASVSVKAPRDPNAVAEPDEPDADLEPLEGAGLDQGITAHVREVLPAPEVSGAPSDETGVRYYMAIGMSTSGRKGLFSKRVAVPLGPAPMAPSKPDVSYDETSVTLTWAPPSAASGATYHVYQLAVPTVAGSSPETRLTTTPVSDPRFVDPRIEWDTERCYAVSSVEMRAGLTSESAPSPPACVTLADRFPPAPPAGLTPVASASAIALTWDPSSEKDLAGYRVLRGPASGDSLAVITPTPIQETTFKDSVEPGVRFAYAVQAVDKAGNVSAPSARVEVTAR